MAAAFAALVSLQNNLHLIQNHPRRSFSFEEEQIRSLEETVRFLINFMKIHGSSEGAQALERRIARAAQAAEDVIESHVVDQIRSGSKATPSRYLLDLQKVIEDMDYMRGKASVVEARSPVETEQPSPPSYSTEAEATSTTPPTTRPSSEKNSMVGFDDDLLRLLDQLTGAPSSRRAIPIVGMGGIGKTTLAAHAFQHPLTVQRFDVCLWASISQQYKVEKILTQLLSNLSKSNTDETTTTSSTVCGLGEQLYKSLYGRRYLIVLDDMWSLEAWDGIRLFFPDTNDGGRIVVTTRHSDVANHLDISSLEMDFLDDENSWDLFCQKAFIDRVCPYELEEIGKEIVDMCKGLPLAIVVLAGHLRKSPMALEYWENVADHIYSVLNSTENEEQCMQILSLSYSFLPPHLKPCFLLLGSFPEDEEIYGRDIRKLWIAEGFIEPKENTSLEEVTEDYLRDLYERNLILVDALGYNGKIVFFKLHDLVRELCIEIGEKEEFLLALDSLGAINRERRVVICGEEAPQGKHRTNTVDAPTRYLIYEGDWPSYDLKLLRTLDTVVPESTSLSVFQQVNLRFLSVDLEHTTLQALYLPSSISLLWNLQMLTIDLPIQSKVIAPHEIWEMLQLRHLEITLISLPDPLPVEGIDDRANDLVLRHLHTLCKVENFRLSEEVCKRIPNIRELHLLYCGEASSYYCPSNLCYFNELEFFSCDFDLNPKWRDFALSFTLPTSLKWLFLSGCLVDWEEMTTMVGSLPHLISLRLSSHAAIGSVWTTVEGKFLSLKNLEIWDCDELVHWTGESSHFPVLENLHLINLSKMDELPLDTGEILTLQRITMEYCSMSSSISAIRALKEQEELGNEGLHLHVSFEGDEATSGSFINQLREEGLIATKNMSLDFQVTKNFDFDFPFKELN